MSEEPKFEYHKTIPWNTLEVMEWEGYRLVYSVGESGLVYVHFPGGKRALASTVVGIKYPQVFRHEKLAKERSYA